MTEILKKIGNFFTLEHDADKAVRHWLQTEYKQDWQSAYTQFKQSGTLPNHVRRTL